MFYQSGILLRSQALELPRVAHGFSTRLGGVSADPATKEMNLAFGREDPDSVVYENIGIFARAVTDGRYGGDRVICAPQIHSDKIRYVTPADAGDGVTRRSPDDEGFDGFVTDKPGVILTVRVADCVPILFAGIKEDGAPAVAAAPEPKEAPSAVTRDELLEILRQMNAAQAAPAPAAAPEPPPAPAAAPAAPAVVEIPVVPVPAETVAVPAPKPRKTGVISSPLRQDQEAKEAAEDAARRARAAAKAEAEAAAAEAAKTAAAPAPEPAPEPAPAAVAKEEKPDAGKRTIAVKPRSRMKVPEGFSTDRAELQTSTGATVPFRLLVPVPDASR